MTEAAQAGDGETQVIVSLSEAAMHMYSAAIVNLPDRDDLEFPEQAAVVLVGLRKLESALSEAASRGRSTPAVIVALSAVRNQYDDLMAMAANGSGATLGQRMYMARIRAKLSPREAANGIGLRPDVIAAVEAEEKLTDGEAARIKELIAALGG